MIIVGVIVVGVADGGCGSRHTFAARFLRGADRGWSLFFSLFFGLFFSLFFSLFFGQGRGDTGLGSQHI